LLGIAGHLFLLLPSIGIYFLERGVVPVDRPDAAAPFELSFSSAKTATAGTPPNPGTWKSFIAIAADVLVLRRGLLPLGIFCSFL